MNDVLVVQEYWHTTHPYSTVHDLSPNINILADSTNTNLETTEDTVKKTY